MVDKEDVEMEDILGNPIVLKDIPIIFQKDGSKYYDVDALIRAEMIANAKKVVEQKVRIAELEKANATWQRENKKLQDEIFEERGKRRRAENHIGELEGLLKTTHTHIAKYLPQDNVNYEILTTIEKALKEGES